MESCPGTGWWVEFEVNNSGQAPFEVIALFVTDTVTGTIRTMAGAEFTDRNGCNELDTLDNLPPGATHIVSSSLFTYDPTGHPLHARITLCANPGPAGICLTENLEFTP